MPTEFRVFARGGLPALVLAATAGCSSHLFDIPTEPDPPRMRLRAGLYVEPSVRSHITTIGTETFEVGAVLSQALDEQVPPAVLELRRMPRMPWTAAEAAGLDVVVAVKQPPDIHGMIVGPAHWRAWASATVQVHGPDGRKIEDLSANSSIGLQVPLGTTSQQTMRSLCLEGQRVMTRVMIARILNALNRSSAARPTALAGDIDGRPCWWVAVAGWSGLPSGPPDVLDLELHLSAPDAAAEPECVVEAARRQSGGWRAVETLIPWETGIRRVRAMLDGDRVAGIAVAGGSTQWTDFLVDREASWQTGRRRNALLLEWKNKSLAAELREARTDDLNRRTVRIEQAVLELARQSERARDRAARAVADGATASAEQFREIDAVYRARVELLKPMLAAIKQELADRNR